MNVGVNKFLLALVFCFSASTCSAEITRFTRAWSRLKHGVGEVAKAAPCLPTAILCSRMIWFHLGLVALARDGAERPILADEKEKLFTQLYQAAAVDSNSDWQFVKQLQFRKIKPNAIFIGLSFFKNIFVDFERIKDWGISNFVLLHEIGHAVNLHTFKKLCMVVGFCALTQYLGKKLYKKLEEKKVRRRRLIYGAYCLGMPLVFFLLYKLYVQYSEYQADEYAFSKLGAKRFLDPQEGALSRGRASLLNCLLLDYQYGPLRNWHIQTKTDRYRNA